MLYLEIRILYLEIKTLYPELKILSLAFKEVVRHFRIPFQAFKKVIWAFKTVATTSRKVNRNYTIKRLMLILGFNYIKVASDLTNPDLIQG